MCPLISIVKGWARRVRVLLFLSTLAYLGSAALAADDHAKVATTLSPDGGRLIVDVQGVPAAVPAIYGTTVDQTVLLNASEITSEARVRFHPIQGKSDVFVLGLAGEGEIVDVLGNGLRDWSVRRGASNTKGSQALELRLSSARDRDKESWSFLVRTRTKKPTLGKPLVLLTFTAGDAANFMGKVNLQSDPALDYQIVSLAGAVAVDDAKGADRAEHILVTGEGRIELKITQRDAMSAEAELSGATLVGRVNELTGSVEFRLQGQIRSRKIGARLPFLLGRAALTDKTSSEGWHVELRSAEENRFVYELVSDKVGVSQIELPFVASVVDGGGWRRLDFSMPAGAIVPLQLDGLSSDVTFNSSSSIVPTKSGETWKGYLPGDGQASLAWKRSTTTQESALFFTSSELSDVRISAGVMRESDSILLRVLQGKLNGIRFHLDGPGEVVGVEGTNVISWQVVTEGKSRSLEVKLSRPLETEGNLLVRAQTELGAFPIKTEPLRLIPEGATQHSGFVRVANAGAVKLELANTSGLMQLTPTQYPGKPAEAGARQVLVFRFPSSQYHYEVLAQQIQPEVSVSQVATYELAETDRVINAALELDVREAPLRDWTLQIPEDYSVVSVIGSEVADYVAESATAEGYRALKVIFAKAIEGRQLIELRLEKNQSAAAGEWNLKPLRFVGVKTVRGHVGVVAAAGYRVTPAQTNQLSEIPLSYFPKQIVGLQQTWRVREAAWTANLRVEALGQSIQADVFHLYSIKEGTVYGSVLLNYFVVGAPATEWRIEVPPEAGNIDIVGQNVRRDWRREGNQLIVSLHQPVLGAATLLITFEQPISARGGTIKPGQIRPVGVQAERGFIDVVSPLQVKHDIKLADGLLRLEPLELPAEFRLLTNAPALAAFQYTARPFNLEVGLEWYAPGETVDQVVDFVKLASQVTRDGQVVTDATYYVKTKGKQSLRLTLPEDVKLWETRVDNEVTNARIDQGHLIIPLSPRLNPNDPVEVKLRFGTAGHSRSSVTLALPRTQASTIMSEWVLQADAGRVLVPKGGNVEVTEPPLTETGFEWITSRGLMATLVLFGLLALARFARSAAWIKMLSGLLAGSLAIGLALVLANRSMIQCRDNLTQLKYDATLVPAEQAVSIKLANVYEWQAMLVGWGVAVAFVGVAILVFSFWRQRKVGYTASGIERGLTLLGSVALATGILAQHRGAPIFFGVTALALLFAVLVPALVRLTRLRREQAGRTGQEPPSGAQTVLSMLTAIGLAGVTLLTAPNAKAQSAENTAQENLKTIQAISQTWAIHDDRVLCEMDVTVRGSIGDAFVLLYPPAVLTDFKGEGLRVSKNERDAKTLYLITLEKDGVVTAHARYELPIGDRSQSVVLPTGPAATQRVKLELDQPGWEFTSTTAVQTLPTASLGDNKSGATLVFAPGKNAAIKLQPKRRNVAEEKTQFFSEAANLYLPGPGMVNGVAAITIRPVQGRVSEVDIDVPKGLTVGDVTHGPVGTWRFDPEKRRLHIAVEPAQSEPFQFHVETQFGISGMPYDVSLQPLHVVGANGEGGLVALAFGGDAQPENVRVTGLSAVNLQDFDNALLPKNRAGQQVANLQQAWRYGQAGGDVHLRIAPVAPEVRVASRQLLTLDDERLVMAVDLSVGITRVGLFKLSFVLPEGLEVESISGAAFNQWTEAQEQSQRVVTLQLNGRTLGEQTFALTLTGPAPHAQAAWRIPKLAIREATRQTGEALIVPGKGLRLQAADREKATQVDPRSLGALQPGTLAFRLLQEDWSITLGIEALDPWITVQALQEVTLREGQTLTRLGLRYSVENAAVKLFRVKLPGLAKDRASTVRATGANVSEIVAVAGQPDLWEIHLKRGVIGETAVQIEFQGAVTRSQNLEAIIPIEFPDTRRVVQFVAVRGSGRLELDASALPRGWTKTDWSAVPVALQDRNERSVPALCYRVAEAEAPLSVTVRRNEVADALKLQITQGELQTLFSPQGTTITAVNLQVDVLEKSTLRVRLPAGAQLFNTFVNGESVAVVREGDAYLFHVAPNSESDRAATVRLVYSVTGRGAGEVVLSGPSLNVPLQNVSWKVVVPPGYRLENSRGGLRLQDEGIAEDFGLDDYRSLVGVRRTDDAKRAIALLERANSLLQKGEQAKASDAFSRASNSRSLDEAANEDARVQLRNLKTQQTVLGLTTRRQRLYLDNHGDAVRNEQMDHAVNANPLMQGKETFNPAQVDEVMAANSVEENTALRGIASRLVDQQLGADAAPSAIDVTLPERGRVFTFVRSLQVDGEAPLSLTLAIGKVANGDATEVVILLSALAAALGLLVFGKRRTA